MKEPSLHLVHTFVAVVKHQSFAKAARELAITPSSVSRLVKALEDQLGTPLINRTTRAMSLTEAGKLYFAECGSALEQVRAAFERIRDQQDLPRGVLKLSVPVVFGRLHVLPHLSAFMEAFPSIQAEVLMTDRYVDIIAEGVTLAIRIGELADSHLIARKLLDNRRVLVASPRYIERHGMPRTIDEITQHACLVSTASESPAWRLIGPDGQRVIRPHPKIRADNGEAIMQFALDGHGLAFHSSVILSHRIRSGELTQVLPEWTGRQTGVYCVYPPRPLGPAARAFIDFLTSRWASERLGEMPQYGEQMQ